MTDNDDKSNRPPARPAVPPFKGPAGGPRGPLRQGSIGRETVPPFRAIPDPTRSRTPDSPRAISSPDAPPQSSSPSPEPPFGYDADADGEIAFRHVTSDASREAEPEARVPASQAPEEPGAFWFESPTGELGEPPAPPASPVSGGVPAQPSMPVPDPLVQGSASLRLSDLVRPATEAESAAENREAAALSGEEETRPRAAPPAKQPSPPSFAERLFDELGFPRTESELGRRNDAGPRESGAVPWSGREFDRGGWHEQGEQLALALEAIAHRFRTGELAAPQFDAAVGDAAALAAALAAVLGIRS